MPVPNDAANVPGLRENNMVEMGIKDIAYLQPIKVKTFYVNLEVDGTQHITFRYHHAESRTVSSHDEFKNYLYELSKGWTNIWDNPVQVSTPGETSFSISNKDDCYIVYILDYYKNWQFMHDYFPFKVEEGKESYYFNATKVDKDGGFHPDPERGEGHQQAKGCRVAFFFAQGSEDQSQSGSGDDKHYRTKFNFYIDLKLNQFGHESILPIIVDPDIGHPGGSDGG